MGSSSYRGIQTIRNWPGCPPRSARKRYVIVVGVSRTISRRGTTWILGMGDPDRLRYGVEARFLEEGGHFLYDFVEDAEAPREDRGPDLDCARAGHDVLQGVATRSDPTDTDHGDMDLLADVVHGPHADRSDRGTAQPAVLVRERRHLQFWGDCHRLHCVERDNRRVRIALARLRTHALRDDGTGARLIHAAHRTAGLIEKTGGKHRRVSQGHAGDLRPEVHHSEHGISGSSKGFGGSRTTDPIETAWCERVGAAPWG